MKISEYKEQAEIIMHVLSEVEVTLTKITKKITHEFDNLDLENLEEGLDVARSILDATEELDNLIY